jgi:hypothetical protein
MSFSIKGRLLGTVATIVVRSDSESHCAIESLSLERNSRTPFAGNPGGFNITNIPRHLWDNESMYGSVERMKQIKSKPVSANRKGHIGRES